MKIKEISSIEIKKLKIIMITILQKEKKFRKIVRQKLNEIHGIKNFKLFIKEIYNYKKVEKKTDCTKKVHKIYKIKIMAILFNFIINIFIIKLII